MSSRPESFRPESIVDAAYAIVTSEGVGALTARRLATAAGTSTMRVYTHFGSVGGVAAAVCERGFAEFADALHAVGVTADPLADLIAQGFAYLRFATTHPQLYTLMFQYTSPEWAAGGRKDLLQHGRPTNSPAGLRAFTAMTDIIRRAAGDDADETALLLRAGETWSATHGLAMLEIAGHLPGVRDAVAESMFVTLAVGHGVARADAERALADARDRV